MDMKPYEPPVPTKIAGISIELQSNLKNVLGEDGNPTGETTVKQTLVAIAHVEDQNGNEVWHHSADHTQLLEHGFITQSQLNTLNQWLTNFRAKLDEKLLP